MLVSLQFSNRSSRRLAIRPSKATHAQRRGSGRDEHRQGELNRSSEKCADSYRHSSLGGGVASGRRQSGMATAEGLSGSATAEAGDGPVLSMMNKRLRALRKKYNRILQMEEGLAQGKSLNKEQEEVLRSKDAIAVLIEEYEKLRVPLTAAVQEELSLAHLSSSPAVAESLPSPPSPAPEDERHETKPGQVEAAAVDGEGELQSDPDAVVEDLLKLLYFGCLFDVKSQNEFASMVFTRTHERECCLTYDYVTDDSTGFLQEDDLDLISALGSLIISRPAHSGVSHKNALLGCLQHANHWLRNSDEPIQPGSSVTYAGLRESFNKILASDYFTTTPELKAPVDVAAAVGKYATYQVQVSDSTPQPPSSHVGVPPVQQQVQEDNSENYEIKDSGSDQFNTVDDCPKTDESDVVDTSGEANAVQHGQLEDEQIQRDAELMEQQYAPRRSYQNQRGGARVGGGGRRGYGNGRGIRGGRGGGYQNGRSQYYDPGYYPRNYYNTRGRGGRGGAPALYNHAGAAHGGGGVPGNIELGSGP